MLQRLKLWLHNLAYKNRRNVRAGNQLQLPLGSAQLMKKVRIKLGGCNNRLLIGENVILHNLEIRLDGQGNLIEIGDDVRKIKDNDSLLVDAQAGFIEIQGSGERIACPPVPTFMQEIRDKGGLVPYVRETLAARG